MTFPHVAVATITWARTPDEATLLLRSLERLSALGLPIAVADAGKDAAFTARLRRLPNLRVVVPESPGLVAQVERSLTAAAECDRPFVLYVEPDKLQFFQHGLHTFLLYAPVDAGVGIVIASRSPNSFDTFPPMQRYTEAVMNHLCAQTFGAHGDYSYGPFLIRRTLLSQLLPLPAHLGWGWRHFAFMRAHRLGLRLVHIVGDHPCPTGQQVEDHAERGHRIRQLSQNLLGLIEP